MKSFEEALQIYFTDVKLNMEKLNLSEETLWHINSLGNFNKILV